MDESILNRDMNCHPVRLETIQYRITPWLCSPLIIKYTGMALIYSTYNHLIHFKKSWLAFLLDSLKYSRRHMAMVHYRITTYIKCLDTADCYHQCGRRNAGCTSTITHDLKSNANRLTNKAVSPWQMDSPTNAKNCSYHMCTI